MLVISATLATIGALTVTPSFVSGAAIAQSFVAPAPCPTCASSNYVGANSTFSKHAGNAANNDNSKVRESLIHTISFLSTDGTLPVSHVVSGKAFNRIIQIWLENTDYSVAASSPTFQKLAKQGITLSSYLSVTQ